MTNLIIAGVVAVLILLALLYLTWEATDTVRDSIMLFLMWCGMASLVYVAITFVTIMVRI